MDQVKVGDIVKCPILGVPNGYFRVLGAHTTVEFGEMKIKKEDGEEDLVHFPGQSVRLAKLELIRGDPSKSMLYDEEQGFVVINANHVRPIHPLEQLGAVSDG